MKAVLKIFQRALGTKDAQNYIERCGHTFDAVLRKVNIITAENGNCLAEVKIDEAHLNPMKTVHGGFIATLVDTLTSLAIVTHNDCKTISVSTDIHLRFLKAIRMDEEIVIDSKTTKIGKNMAFLECTITSKETGEVLASGSHTKYVTSVPYSNYV